jgi:hypothetical protein
MTRFALGLQRFIDLLPWHIASRIRQHFPPLLRFCFVLNEDPPIVLVPEDFYDDSFVRELDQSGYIDSLYR